MRLHSLTIYDYGVLRGFTLPFSQQDDQSEGLPVHKYGLDLIVGLNGTGKSTLLRAIAEIFRRLYQGATVPFAFSIEYSLYNENDNTTTRVLLSNISNEDEPPPLKDGELRWQINADLKITGGIQGLSKEYLPPLIVAFTTGDEREWQLPPEYIDNSDISFTSELLAVQDIKAVLTQWFLREIPSLPVQEEEPEQPQDQIPTDVDRFLLIKAHHIPLVILCSLLDELHRSQTSESGPQQISHLDQILKACYIKALRGFSLNFRMNKESLQPTDRKFIYELSHIALTIQSGSDYLLVFDLSKIDLEKLLKIKSNALSLFRELVHLSEPQNNTDPILREVNLFLERTTNGDGAQEKGTTHLHLLSWLSDGERSFLGRLCLLSLLGSGKQEALILLDEPEVHFNDFWKRELVTMIDTALEEQQSHVLMTTHSSITLSDVLDRDIWVLQREGNYTHAAYPPALKTLGADPGDIMVYVFGTENSTGAYSTAFIERRLQEIDNFRGEDGRISIWNEQAIRDAKRRQLRDLLGRVGPSDLRFMIRRQLHALEG